MKKKMSALRQLLSWKIPTWGGIFTLLVVLLVASFVNRQTKLSMRASQEITPQRVKITNITHRSFTVSWVTQKPTIGMVKLFPEEKTFLDWRDKENNSQSSYTTHYVVVEGLEADKEYQFFLLSGDALWGKEGKKEGEKFTVKTAKREIAVPQEGEFAYGKVVDAQGQPAGGVIVYLEIPGFSPLSGITSSSGYWMIPFAFAYRSDLSGQAVLLEGEKKEEKIVVDGGMLGQAEVINFTDNNRPVPTITLGENADFRHQSQKVSPSPAATGGYLPRFQGPTEAVFKKVEVINPEEGETIKTTRPEFFGTGPAGETIKIKVESETIFQGEVLVGENGEWRWVPPAGLSPGEHTLTVEFVNSQGQIERIKRKFIVLAADDNLAFVATPSGETPSPSPFPSALPTSSLSGTLMSMEDTPTPSPLPTATPTPVVTQGYSSPTPTAIPQTGSEGPFNALLFFAGAVLGGGVLLLLL